MESMKAEYCHALDIVSQAKGGQWLSERFRYILGYDSVVLSHDKDAPFNGVTAWGVQVDLNKQVFCSSSSLCPGLPLLPLCSSALHPQPHTIGAHSRMSDLALETQGESKWRAWASRQRGWGCTSVRSARSFSFFGSPGVSRSMRVQSWWHVEPRSLTDPQTLRTNLRSPKQKARANEDYGINRIHTTERKRDKQQRFTA